MKSFAWILLASLLLSTSLKIKPSIFLVGDSTVKNGSGKGEKGLWGWGDFLHEQFDTMKVHIENHARGGRSSRTYQTEGLWDNVLARVKPGDFVIMQFGHNDAGPINDTLRARGSIRGVGEETEEIDNLITKKHEVVHSYGWYMRKYIRDTKAKGATPIVCSLVARNVWKDGKVVRAQDSYAGWAQQIAQAEDALYIDLNDLVASRYETLGPEEVKTKLFLEDHTHTTAEGAKINASLVAQGIAGLKNKQLRKLIK
ncbi:rhamnogalacturonan acetylesterase [Pseudochryseolinea flava]|uniref:Lysophospholipase n=1 Tax=Pseudochryseolinea flava TaxID=2059302 RepID=A0A364Y2Y3_9BACT|nr:rhamnogalacturonan acetylesterase [Pseudochryseolinea flava]RAW01126.1 lysophospholipase [Pseudochryseolinea flava]